jgi:nitrogen fixation NifU-like protein
MDNLTLLYQEMILDHCRHPRHFGELSHCTHHAKGFNPLCGDEINVFLNVSNQTIEALQFTGAGCAISIASASLMSEELSGKTITEAEATFRSFLKMLTDSESPSENNIGKLQVLSGVKYYPIRIKCATLAWHAMQAALTQKQATVTTEQP